MTKKNLYLVLQIILGVVIYYLLSSIFENTFVLLGVFVVLGTILIVVKSIYIRNNAEILEVLVKPDKHFLSIKRFELKDPNKYNTLYAYGLSYTGKYDEAQLAIDKVYYKDIKTSANLHYDYFVTKLHLAYNNKDRSQYNEILTEAIGLKVFQKVNIPDGAFEAHGLLLEGYSEEAEELLKNVIPKVRKRVLVIELEYLLAHAYFNQSKIEDSKAICEFIIEKNHQVVHTTLCRELLENIN